MTTNTELELKFTYDATVAQRLASAGYDPAQALRRVAMHATYYDTPAGALAQAHIALRVRRSPQGYVQTVKCEGAAAFERLEYAQALSGPRPKRAALPPPGTAVGDVVHGQFEALQAVFTATFTRSVWRLQASPSLLLEISVDQGELCAAHGRKPGAQNTRHAPRPPPAPIAELEIERLSGTRLAFLRWARQFAAQHKLRLLQTSKQEQGLRLCGRLPQPAALPRAASALRPTDTVGQAGAVAMQGAISHLLANAAALCQGDDPEAVHQLHTGMQHFRATVRSWGLAGHDRRWRTLMAQARRLARTAGLARDTHIFATESLPGVCQRFGSEPALQTLGELLAVQGAQDTQRCREAFCGPAFTAFALQGLYLSERLACGLGMQASRLGLPVCPFLRTQLRQQWQRLRRRMRAAKSPQDWHRARLAAKQLRCALELALHALPAPRRLARLHRVLVALQQTLGANNDRAMAGHTAQRLATLAAPDQTQADQRARALALVEAWSRQSAPRASRQHAAVHKIQARLRRRWRQWRKHTG